MGPFTKPPLSIQDQVELIRSRGLSIPDRNKAEHYLAHISYYRMSAYMLPYQVDRSDHRFGAGATFDQVLDLYVFDRALRLHVFDAIERIEVALRAQITQRMAMQHGSHWHEDRANFRHANVYDTLQDDIKETCSNGRREVFIDHYLRTYSHPPMPACWMCFETLTMGSLSKIYKALAKKEDRKAIAEGFNLPKEVMESWMHALSYVRNLCAHHSRLWNRELGISPIYLKAHRTGPWLTYPYPPNNRMYYVLCCLGYLLGSINPKGTFRDRTLALLEKYRGIPLTSMGFQAGWDTQPLWTS